MKHVKYIKIQVVETTTKHKTYYHFCISISKGKTCFKKQSCAVDVWLRIPLLDLVDSMKGCNPTIGQCRTFPWRPEWLVAKLRTKLLCTASPDWQAAALGQRDPRHGGTVGNQKYVHIDADEEEEEDGAVSP